MNEAGVVAVLSNQSDRFAIAQKSKTRYSCATAFYPGFIGGLAGKLKKLLTFQVVWPYTFDVSSQFIYTHKQTGSRRARRNTKMSTHVDKRRVIVHESDTQNWMEQLLVKVAPYSRSIVALLLAAIALGVVLLLWSQQNEQKVVSDWEQYYQAKDKDFSVSKLDDLKKKIKSLGDSTPGQLLKLQTGQLLMTEGVNDLYKDRTEAKKRLDEAEVMFKELASQTKLEQIREPAMFGLAICTESLGKIDDAIKLYGDMQAAYPHGMYAKSAELRVKRLKEASRQDVL